MKSIDHSLAVLTYSNGIMVVESKDVDMELEGFKELLETAIELAERQPYYCIVDLRRIRSSAPETRSCYADKLYLDFRKADALVVNSLPLRLLANFYIRINKPAIPTRLFNDVNKAKEWIEELRKVEIKTINSLQS